MNHFYKNLLVESLIFVIVVGTLIGGLLFFRTRIAAATDQIFGVNQELNERSAATQLFSLLKSQFSQNGQSYLNVMHNVVPLKDQLIDLRQEFQFLAGKEGLSYSFSFTGEESASSARLGAVQFTLNLQGSMDKLFRFVKNLQSFRYLITLDGFTINRQGNQIQMVIKGQVFFRT